MILSRWPLHIFMSEKTTIWCLMKMLICVKPNEVL